MDSQVTDPTLLGSLADADDSNQKADSNLVAPIKPARIPRWTILALLIVAVSVFQFETLHDSHTWGDDFAVYIIAARRIVNGTPFSDPVAYNGSRKVEIGKRVGYPLVLTPFYYLYGNSCRHLKIPNVVCIVLSSLLLFSLIRTLNGKVWLALLGFILFGIHPYFTFFKNTLGPDILSITTLFALTWFFLCPLKEGNYRPSPMFILFGVLLVFHLLVRRQSWSVLPVAIWWFGWTCFKSYRGKGLTTTLLVAAMILIIMGLVLAEQWAVMVKYFLNSSNFTWTSFKSHVTFYVGAFPHFFNHCSTSSILRSMMVGTWISIAVFGILDRLKRTGFGFLEFLLICYLIPPLFFSALQGERYLLPVFAISFLYLILGLDSLLSYFSDSRSSVAIISLLTISTVFLPMVSNSMTAFRTLPAIEYDGPYNSSAEELFSFVKQTLDPKADVLFFKPRAFKLFTRRTATGSLPTEMGPDLLSSLVNNGQITHVALLRTDEYKSEYRKEEKTRKWVHSIPKKTLLFENDIFALYSVERFN